METPSDVEVRYRHKSGLGWIGYAVHLSEPCDEVWVELMSPVNTTPANIADAKRPDAIQRALVATGPSPNTHLADAGDIAAGFPCRVKRSKGFPW